MAITGTWQDRRGVQAGARKWGTGYNPIHAVRIGDGRDIAVTEQSRYLPEELLPPVDDWCDDSAGDGIWGHSVDDGTADRPNWGTDTQLFRGEVTNDYPAWGEYSAGVPGGTRIRDENRGAEVTNTPKQTPTETVSEGWLNKVTSDVSDSEQPDPIQLQMQTSMLQRDAVRSGSQVPAGRANEFDAPIQQRIPGKKLKVYSGGQRHYDMYPRQQMQRIRSWWSRSAGTGYVDWLEPNEAYESKPLNRSVPAEPYTGPDVPVADNYGFTNEDLANAWY